ncbi:MAG: helix-turn-helix domain-containing protein [Aggregatilineales bacterium]
MTIQFKITAEIQETLNYERYRQPVPNVQRRMEVLWLKSHGLAHEPIGKLGGVSENTLREYFGMYAEGGSEGLKVVHFERPGSELDQHIRS